MAALFVAFHGGLSEPRARVRARSEILSPSFSFPPFFWRFFLSFFFFLFSSFCEKVSTNTSSAGIFPLAYCNSCFARLPDTFSNTTPHPDRHLPRFPGIRDGGEIHPASPGHYLGEFAARATRRRFNHGFLRSCRRRERTRRTPGCSAEQEKPRSGVGGQEDEEARCFAARSRSLLLSRLIMADECATTRGKQSPRLMNAHRETDATPCCSRPPDCCSSRPRPPLQSNAGINQPETAKIIAPSLPLPLDLKSRETACHGPPCDPATALRPRTIADPRRTNPRESAD